MVKKKYKILIVDDEKEILAFLSQLLRHQDLKDQILFAESCSEALEILKEEGTNIRVGIVDCNLPLGKTPSFLETNLFSGGTTGINLCKYIISNFPHIKLGMYTAMQGEEIRYELFKFKIHYIPKPGIIELGQFIKLEMSSKEKKTKSLPNIFIVHGHDEKSLYELKAYITDKLDLGYPIVLKEQPSRGYTVIEKIEAFALNIDLVFVLLTPDDAVTNNSHSYFQARPNVLFELGYFLGRMNRKTGRVIILAKSQINIFSDISGMVCIDISNGISSVTEEIKREVSDWL